MTDAPTPRTPMVWRSLVPTTCECGAPLLIPVGPEGVTCQRCRRRFAIGDRPAATDADEEDEP